MAIRIEMSNTSYRETGERRANPSHPACNVPLVQAWGRGGATEALRQLLHLETVRPFHARVACDNFVALHTLVERGFQPLSETISFANARNADIAETLLELR